VQALVGRQAAAKLGGWVKVLQVLKPCSHPRHRLAILEHAELQERFDRRAAADQPTTDV